MKTMDRTHTKEFTPTAPSAATAPLRHDARRAWWLVAIVAVLALGIGLAVGWLVAPSGDEPAYLADGGKLSARQEQMVDLTNEAVKGWRSGDADAVLATFTPSAILTWGAQQFRADDGTFASFVSRGWASLEVLEPMLVDGNRVTFFYTHGSGRYLGAMEFTTTGEVLATEQWIDM
jgi:hypothetical protein